MSDKKEEDMFWIAVVVNTDTWEEWLYGPFDTEAEAEAHGRGVEAASGGYALQYEEALEVTRV